MGMSEISQFQQHSHKKKRGIPESMAEYTVTTVWTHCAVLATQTTQIPVS